MPAVNPGMDRRGADLDESCGFTNGDDCVVVLRPDAIEAAELYAVPVLAARLTRRFPPGLDLVVCGKDVTGVEEIGRTQFPDWSDVAARDPASNCRQGHAQQVGHIARGDLFPVAQVLDGIVVFVEGGPPHRGAARTRTALEPRSVSGTRRKPWQRCSWIRYRGLVERWMRWEWPGPAPIGQVTTGHGTGEGAQVGLHPFTISPQPIDHVTARQAERLGQFVDPHRPQNNCVTLQRSGTESQPARRAITQKNPGVWIARASLGHTSAGAEYATGGRSAPEGSSGGSRAGKSCAVVREGE
jgi:hypothetical protein